MNIFDLLVNFFFSFLATAGFSIFFNSPKKSLFPVGIIGGIGWTVYILLFNFTENSILSNFLAATLISLLSEILARKMKYPAIIFAIPGILPLIPGLGLYNTMLSLVEGNYLNAASIAMGVLFITSLVKTYFILIHKIQKSKLQLQKLIK